MAFFRLADRRQHRGFPGSTAIASCSARLAPQFANGCWRARTLKLPLW